MSYPEKSLNSAENPSLLIDQIPLGIVIVDKNKQLHHINSKARQLLGSEKPLQAIEQYLGNETQKSWWESIFSIPWPLDTRDPLELELENQVLLVKVFNPGNPEKLGLLIEDVTTEKKALLRFFHQAGMASVGFLAAGLAHEFQNIMASLDGRAQIAHLKDDLEGYRKLENLVRQQCKRGAGIIRSLMSFSASMQSGIKENTEISKLIEEALGMVGGELKKNHVDLQVELSTKTYCRISTGEFQQSFLNIVQNACEAMSPNGGILRIRLFSTEKKACLEITDSGKGIEPQHLKKILQPFFTTKGHGSHFAQQGSGLGLSVAYNTIRRHGGEISIDSTIHKGTTVILCLPASQK